MSENKMNLDDFFEEIRDGLMDEDRILLSLIFKEIKSHNCFSFIINSNDLFELATLYSETFNSLPHEEQKSFKNDIFNMPLFTIEYPEELEQYLSSI